MWEDENSAIVLPTSLGALTQGTPFTGTVAKTSGGTGAVTYAVTAGTLPTGLTLNNATGAITGTPTGTGAYNFTITATDSATPIAATKVQLYTGTIADTTAPTLSGVTVGPVTIGTNVSATSNEAGTLYLVPKAIYADKAALDAVTLNKVTAVATAATAANLATTGVVAGTYQVYAVDAAGNVSAASADIVVNAAPTANVGLALTTPTVDAGNTINDGTGATTAVAVNVVNTTDSVVLTGTKTEAQTVTISGTNASFVTAGGTDTNPTYTVNTDAIKTSGGSYTFTLTVSEAGKADIVYTVTVTVAGA